MKKTLTLKPAPAPKQPSLADLEAKAIASSKAYIESQLAVFKDLRRTAGYED